MTRVIERRQAAAPGETVLELRFFRTKKKNAEVRAYISCDDVIIDMESDDVVESPCGRGVPRRAGTVCEKEGIASLWMHDPLACFRLRLDPQPARQRR